MAAIVVMLLGSSLAPPISGKLALTYGAVTAAVVFPGVAICLALFERGKSAAYFSFVLLAFSPASFMALKYFG
jgi:hypothetical protein